MIKFDVKDIKDTKTALYRDSNMEVNKIELVLYKGEADEFGNLDEFCTIVLEGDLGSFEYVIRNTMVG